LEGVCTARRGTFHDGPYFFYHVFLRGSSPVGLFPLASSFSIPASSSAGYHENRHLQRQFTPQTSADRAGLAGPAKARCALSSRNQSPGQRVSAAGIGGIRVRHHLPGDEVLQRGRDIEPGETRGGVIRV